jgi:tRNA(fMet)-specific endonuclease VapC
LTYLLDTNVLSVALRDANSLPAVRLRRQPRIELFVPAIVRAELTFGALKGGSPNRLDNLRTFLGEFPTLAFDDSCIEVYASARNKLERTGQRIGALDLMIASIALAHGLVLVTHNTAEFARVPELRFEDWQMTLPGV